VARNAFADAPPAPVPPAVVSRDEEGHVTIRAVRLTEPIVLDGRLDERVYHDTEPIDGFVQQEPHEGAGATEKTEVWVAYDDNAVYVGARLWESEASKRVMSDMRRDASNLSNNNDHFAIMLDTFYDRRNGYVFLANAQGGMMDAQVVNENADVNWNTIWETRAADFEGGWTIEFRIPFRSIRFSETSNVWGINFRRLVRWKTEKDFLARVPASYDNNALYKTSSGATLVGIVPPSKLRNIDFKPYALGSSATNRTVRPAISNDGNGEFGADLKWGVTQSVVADATYNTDFAQVEDDEQQVNLTRFSLLFPEKREFFIEGQQFFNFGIQGGTNNNADLPAVFFSRRIGLENGGAVPIVGGGRLQGRVGKNRIGVLQMRTDAAPEVNAVATDFSVARVQRDFLRRSRIGLIGTRRAPSSSGLDTSNYAYGADGVFQFFQNIQFTEYIAKTSTPGKVGRDGSFRSRFVWSPDRWGVDLEHLYAGRNFNPEVGFVRRTDGFRRNHGKFSYSPRPKNIPSIRKFTYTADVEYFTDDTFTHVQSRDQQGNFRIDFTNGDSMQLETTRTFEGVNAPFTVAKGVRIPIGGYDYTQYRAVYSFGSQRKVSGSMTARSGDFYHGSLHELTWKGRAEFSPQLYIEPTLSWNHVDGPYGTGNNNLVSNRLTYTLSPKMFVSALVQYQSRTDSVSTNARFRWEYRPGSELFVVYNDGRTTTLPSHGFPDLQTRSFIVKVTRLFQM
jgi:hypothetical protein